MIAEPQIDEMIAPAPIFYDDETVAEFVSQSPALLAVYKATTGPLPTRLQTMFDEVISVEPVVSDRYRVFVETSADKETLISI